ncbi:hypothetical protein VTK26DRAFT_8630 [Humicola hyalothermophila]
MGRTSCDEIRSITLTRSQHGDHDSSSPHIDNGNRCSVKIPVLPGNKHLLTDVPHSNNNHNGPQSAVAVPVVKRTARHIGARNMWEGGRQQWKPKLYHNDFKSAGSPSQVPARGS